MDNYKIYLTKELEQLTSQNRLLFAYWISKRLFHNYVYFNNVTSFGDIDVLFDAFNLIEKYLKYNIKDENDIRDAIYSVDLNTPDTNDFSTILVSFALDSCNALYECLQFIIDEDISHIVDVGLFARDTVDMFIQEAGDLNYSDPNFEYRIKNHDLMKSEMKAQEEFLLKLKSDYQISLREIVFDKIIDPEDVNDLLG